MFMIQPFDWKTSSRPDGHYWSVALFVSFQFGTLHICIITWNKYFKYLGKYFSHIWTHIFLWLGTRCGESTTWPLEAYFPMWKLLMYSLNAVLGRTAMSFIIIHLYPPPVEKQDTGLTDRRQRTVDHIHWFHRMFSLLQAINLMRDCLNVGIFILDSCSAKRCMRQLGWAFLIDWFHCHW